MASPKSCDEPTVLVHGVEWRVKDIKDNVNWCLTQTWHHEKWKGAPALIHKHGGTSSQYLGQKYDPKKIDLVEDGWTHEHCSICWWTLHESDDQDETNSWICIECYNQFIRDNVLNQKRTANKTLDTKT